MFHVRLRHGTATLRPSSARPANHPLPHALRQRSEAAEPTPTDPHARSPELARLEAVLLLADEPLPARRLAEAADLADASEARKIVDQLRELYDADGSAFQVEEIAGGYQLLTRPRYHPWLARLKRTGHELKLTPTVLETLAVIAYKQPITRADIEKVRGVACAAGRHDSLGRPQLYGTTKKFLQAFGLNAIKDLPEVEALRNPGA